MTSNSSFRIVLALGGFAVLVGILVALPLCLETEVPAKRSSPKVFRRGLCDNAAFSCSGLHGVDLIRCGACRIEKMKRGVLTFGGYNELVIDDLTVVIPSAESATNATVRADASAAVSPKQILQSMGIGDEFFSLRKLPFRFSGLRINRLCVSRLAGTNVVPRFSAAYGVARRGGLSLAD